MNDDDEPISGEEPVILNIDGTLDLHQFSPRDVPQLIPDYLEACRRRGIFAVRIVHGKGTGQLRRSVHALLQRSQVVQDFRIADETGGSWGATLVTLKKS